MAQITTPQGVTLEYETAGSAEHPAILMMMGFGSQLVSWPREFCRLLADGGRYVISFDNRDCGLSQKWDPEPANVEQILLAASAGEFARARQLAAYTFDDMADDAIGLLTALGIGRAHLVGASMGAMIAQTVAINHRSRVASLTSMMSSTGEPEYGQSEPASLEALLTPSPTDREGYIESAQSWLVWHSKRYPELEETRAIAAETYDRGLCPDGTQRQLAAMIASGPRAEGLSKLDVPTLVIHGLDDTLITPSGGQRTAELIPDAELMLVPDMGHDRPKPLWPRLVEAILEHTARAPD
jgi:pimeloyl-ACP methyl ester carboxylesterase